MRQRALHGFSRPSNIVSGIVRHQGNAVPFSPGPRVSSAMVARKGFYLIGSSGGGGDQPQLRPPGWLPVAKRPVPAVTPSAAHGLGFQPPCLRADASPISQRGVVGVWEDCNEGSEKNDATPPIRPTFEEQTLKSAESLRPRLTAFRNAPRTSRVDHESLRHWLARSGGWIRMAHPPLPGGMVPAFACPALPTAIERPLPRLAGTCQRRGGPPTLRRSAARSLPVSTPRAADARDDGAGASGQLHHAGGTRRGSSAGRDGLLHVAGTAGRDAETGVG